MPDDQATTDIAESTQSVPGPKVSGTVGDGKTMHVKVYAPFKIYFDGVASSISAVNDTGPFDILPKHHNFMTLLNEGEIVVRSQKGEDRVAVTRGMMHVKADEVVVFLDI